MPISRQDMAAHIDTGRAEPWTQSLAGVVPTAVKMDDTWYVVLDGTDHYQPAPPPLAAVLTQAHTLLATADQKVAQADTQQR